ncbi:ribonuclease H-like protein, partial [Athelia psychrophila]
HPVANFVDKGPPSKLDLLLAHVLESSTSQEGTISSLYGTTHENTTVRSVYTDGSCLYPNTPRAQAGSGIYWNPNDARNISVRLPGLATNNRAELYAVLWVIVHSPVTWTLYIYTDSTYAIHSVCHWAPSRAAKGWRCKNADILQDIVLALRNRHAAVKMFWVPGHSGNVHNDGADKLAKEGA